MASLPVGRRDGAAGMIRMPLRVLGAVASRRQFAAAGARRVSLAADGTAALAETQLRAVQRVWADAIADVPYYASLVASGQAPREVRSWPDVLAIPELTRQVLQDHHEAFVRRSGPPQGTVRTGGSTATPLQIGMNAAERNLMRVVKLAAWQTLGYTASSRVFIIWGHAHLLGTGWRGRVVQLQRQLADAALGYQRVSAYRMNRETAEDYAARIVRYRPAGLIGYAAALDLFGRYAAPWRARLRDAGLRFVLTTTEPPPRPDTIAMLGDLFASPVVQEYGGAEFGQVAFKREPAPFEVYGDLNYVEASAPPADEPHAHPLLMTSLYSRYVPLIRYRNGDAVSGLHRLAHGHVDAFTELAGRLNDVVYLADGDGVHSEAVLHCVRSEAAVYNVQMVLSDQGIRLHLITTDGDRQALEARIRARLRQVHPLLASVQFQFVEDVMANRAGKRRWFVDERTSPPSAMRGAGMGHLS